LAWGPLVSAESVEEVESLNNRVSALYDQGKYAEAVALGIKVLKIAEESLGPEHPTTATSLNNLAVMYKAAGDYAKAVPLSERGLKIREKVLGPEHPFTARSMNNLANLYGEMGQYTNAEPLFQRALAINEKVLGPDNEAVAISASSLGVLYLEMGEYGKAEPYLQRSLKIREKVHGPEGLQTATALNNLGALYGAMGDYGKAEPLFQRAQQIRQKVLGPEHPETATGFQSLGTFYETMGDYAKAEPAYQQALKIREKSLGPEHPGTAKTLKGLAMLYMQMGDYGRAEPLLQRALKIQEKALGAEHPETAKTLASLAGLYASAGNLSQAELLDKQVLQIQEKALGPWHLDVAIGLSNLGIVCEKRGDYTNAELLQQRALRILEKTLGKEHPAVATSLNNLGSIYSALGKYDEAGRLERRALSINEKVLGPNHPNTVLSLKNLGYLFFDTQEKSEALQMADKAGQAELRMMANMLSFTSEQQRLVYQAQCNPYSLFASLKSGPRIALAILQNKGVVLDSLLEDRLVAEAGQNPADRALIEQIGPAKQRLTQLLMEAPKDMSEQARQKRAEAREKLASEVEQLEGALARKVAGLGHARRALSVTVEQVQGAIPERAALIELLRYHHYLGRRAWEERYGAAVITRAGEPKWVCLGAAAAIETNVLCYQQCVRRRTGEAGLASNLRALYQQLWAPLKAVLPAETKTIIISPDAALNFISYATLLTPDDEFFAQQYSIRYVASGRDVLCPAKAPQTREMVIFAAPDYSGGKASARRNPELYLEPLPNLALNAAALEAQAKSWNWPVHVYSGADASESRVRAVHSPRILHLATHGFFLPETIRGAGRFSYFSSILDPNGFKKEVVLRNPMYRSGVALAGAQVTLDAWTRGEIPNTDNDGILTAEEVGSLDLQNT
jgi:tetratricopeptide (TPR) repeat protein/CHAT domain-containing protein